AAFKQELDQLTELLSHKIPGGELAAVLREAVQCAIERHGKRRGAVEPTRKRAKQSPTASPPAPTQASEPRDRITAEVRREVWKRDEGRCAWVGPDGHRCGSRWRLELDHIEAAALGGPSTIENLRLTCAQHNRLHAEQTFGRAFMDRFRKPRTGESTSPRAPRGSCSVAHGE
ncbi:MAG TPA: HNH endonuclease signature motif containing protein, partial [Anaeromyxobacteraceae bacterium]|nr:HNH endonuclease signature motif containing protein [Anaeromyxobacteraceae bacterium]